MAAIERTLQRRGFRQFIKFALVGVSGFLVNLALFTVLQQLLPVGERERAYYLLFSVAFLAGGLSNYFLNRIWTFRSTAHPFKEGLQFMSVSAAALCVGLLVSYAVKPYLGSGHRVWFIGTLAGIFVSFFINFFVNKYWTFRSVL